MYKLCGRFDCFSLIILYHHIQAGQAHQLGWTKTRSRLPRIHCSKGIKRHNSVMPRDHQFERVVSLRIGVADDGNGGGLPSVLLSSKVGVT